MSQSPSPLLVVDLDGTLVHTDTVVEQTLLYLKRHPFSAWRLLVLAMRGRLVFKDFLAQKAPLDVTTLPYRKAVIDLIENERRAGRKVALVSAAHESTVKNVAAHLNIFDIVAGSSTNNIKGPAKLKFIEALTGGGPFRYAGDANADRPIWSASTSAQAIVVNPWPSVIKQLGKKNVPILAINDGRSKIKAFIRQLRPHQWVKNCLLFVPILAGHHFLDADKWREGALAFAAFSLSASAVYFFNDLFDLESDRAHSSKKSRPFAAGSLPLLLGFATVPILALAALGISFFVNFDFTCSLFLYFALNLLYSLWLKNKLALDVTLLAGLYTLRIYAGGVATGIAISEWLVSFSTFFFFGLAVLKRFIELDKKSDGATIAGRGYAGIDKESVYSFGSTSSLLSVVICILYFNSDKVKSLYTHSDRLWLLAPLFTYWSFRVWLLARRGEIHDDPVLFAVKDRVSWVVLAGILLDLYISI